MNIELKTVTPTDYPAVLEVYRQCEDFLALGPVSKASMEMVKKDIEEADVEKGHFRGVFLDGKMVGVVSFVPSQFEFRPVDAFILLLMIAEPYRGKGIGTAVLEMVEREICHKKRIRSIRCGVQINNPKAISFWEKHGYYKFAGPDLMPDKTTVYRMRKDISGGGKTNG